MEPGEGRNASNTRRMIQKCLLNGKKSIFLVMLRKVVRLVDNFTTQ